MDRNKHVLHGRCNTPAHKSAGGGQNTWPNCPDPIVRTVNAYYLYVQSCLRQFGVIVVLLMLGLAPTMVCLTSESQMSEQERACCRMMKNQCDLAGMSASHGCCKQTSVSAHGYAIESRTTSLRLVSVAAIDLDYFELLPAHYLRTGWVDRPEYGPPESPPTTAAVLRV